MRSPTFNNDFKGGAGEDEDQMPAACSYQRGARSSAISFYKFAIMQSTSQAGAQGGLDAYRQELPTRCAVEFPSTSA